MKSSVSFIWHQLKITPKLLLIDFVNSERRDFVVVVVVTRVCHTKQHFIDKIYAIFTWAVVPGRFMRRTAVEPSPVFISPIVLRDL